MQSSKESVFKAKIENRLVYCERAVGYIHEDSQRHDYSFGSLFMRLMKKKSLVTRGIVWVVLYFE